MLVGEGRAGKTSCMKALLSQPFDAKQASTNMAATEVCTVSRIAVASTESALWEKLEDGLKALGGELSKAIGSILGEMELDARDMDLLREEQEEFGSRVKQAILEGTSHKEAVASAIAQLRRGASEKETRAQLEELTQRSSEAQGIELSGSEIAAIVKTALEV